MSAITRMESDCQNGRGRDGAAALGRSQLSCQKKIGFPGKILLASVDKYCIIGVQREGNLTLKEKTKILVDTSR